MVIFVVAALAGFLLFGWFQTMQRMRPFFLNPGDQRKLGVRVLYVLLLLFIALMFPNIGRILPGDWWSEYLAIRIVQVLTGTEATRLILGVAFGCILRYWGSQFWAVHMPPETRYNWVAISLAGLILLAAAAPYLERKLGSMTGLKTPIAEFQFSSTSRGKVDTYLFEKQLDPSKTVPYFAANTFVGPDLAYVSSFPNQKDHGFQKKYGESLQFIEAFLEPLNLCARQAYNNYLDIESIRHSLSPVAQQLRLLIQSDNRKIQAMQG